MLTSTTSSAIATERGASVPNNISFILNTFYDFNCQRRKEVVLQCQTMLITLKYRSSIPLTEIAVMIHFINF